MTYKEFIQNIIDTRGQWNIPAGEYYEIHHIVPKSLGGLPKHPSKKSKHANIIWLTAKEHYFVHQLLALENSDNYSIVNSFYLMSHSKRTKEYLDIDAYESLKIKYSKMSSEKHSGKNNFFYGKKHSVESIEKMKRTKEINGNLHRKLSEDEKERLSIIHKGQGLGNIYVYKDSKSKSIKKDDLQIYLDDGWQLGNGSKGKKKMSEITRKKLSEKNILVMKKLKQDAEKFNLRNKKISDRLKGIKRSEETKKKMSLSKLKNKEPKIKIEKCKKVMCIELNIVYNSIKEAAKSNNAITSHISKCCKGKLKTHRGYHWKYV